MMFEAIVARPVKRWMGLKPVACDLCHHPLKTQFVDGSTKMGPWAIMCMTCHGSMGRGLGLGRGQLYNLETLEKVSG